MVNQGMLKCILYQSISVNHCVQYYKGTNT